MPTNSASTSTDHTTVRIETTRPLDVSYKRRMKRFLISFCAMMTLTLGTIAAINLYIDPYYIYRMPWSEKFDKFKVESSRVKTAGLLYIDQPDVVITGSSRTVRGVDTTYSGWGANAELCRSAAMPGTHATELRDAVRLAVDSGAQRLYVFIDFHMFGGDQDPVHDYVRSCFNPNLDPVGYHAANLFSMDSLIWSHRTYKTAEEGRRHNTVYVQTGFRKKGRPRRDTNHREGFDNLIRGSIKIPAMYGPGFSYQPSLVDTTLSDIITRCRRHDIELTIAIMPIHAVQMEVIRAGGWWDDFERFKADVTHAVAAHQNDVHSVAIFDFATFNSYTTEPIPPRPLHDADGKEGGGMQWWWESSHSTKELGHVVTDIVTGHTPPDRAGGFGARLIPQSIDVHLATIREKRESWASNNEHEIARVRRIVSAALKATNRSR